MPKYCDGDCLYGDRMHIELEGLKCLVVGAGFYGSVIAEHVARVLGARRVSRLGQLVRRLRP